MGCCSSGGSCGCKTGEKEPKVNSVLLNINSFYSGKLDTFDWMSDFNNLKPATNIVEVRFKNTRKEFFINESQIKLEKNDRIVVEANPGHDIGTISLTGELALKQFEKKIKNPDTYKLRKIYRVANDVDLNRWIDAKKRERSTMIRARQIARELKLNMKIGDVEFQGDGRKAIFYYIADDRVDFRQLIKQYATEFRIKVEMKQIGVRQESGLIGGIGSCGRELCCSTWRTDLASVSTDAARVQELPLNAQKLAGQCGKLKCCLMYELETYLEAKEEFPKVLLELETQNGMAYPIKTDVLKKQIWYSFDPEQPVNTTAIPITRVKEIITENKKGIKVPSLTREAPVLAQAEYTSAAGTEDLDRFKKNTLKSGNSRKKKSNRKRSFQKKN